MGEKWKESCIIRKYYSWTVSVSTFSQYGCDGGYDDQEWNKVPNTRECYHDFWLESQGALNGYTVTNKTEYGPL